MSYGLNVEMHKQVIDEKEPLIILVADELKPFITRSSTKKVPL